MNQTVTVHAPATVANMVCGFDILGFALREPYDTLTVSLSGTPGVQIVNEDDFNLPVRAVDNVSGAALMEMLLTATDITGFQVVSNKKVKPGSGIGSSASSAAGVVVAANRLLGNRFSRDELMRFAMAGEKLASGVKHADNIAPCICGGVTLVRNIYPLDVVPLRHPPLHVTVVHPQIEVRTSDARNILKQQLLLRDAIKQWGNIAGLVAGLLEGDYDLIGRSLEDVIIEPQRSILIPGFNDVKQHCREAGALGGGISGSGPSVFMLSKDANTAQTCGGIMNEVYGRLGIDCHVYVTTINEKGVEVV